MNKFREFDWYVSSLNMGELGWTPRIIVDYDGCAKRKRIGRALHGVMAIGKWIYRP